jgi:4-hydroxyproline epimerase
VHNVAAHRIAGGVTLQVEGFGIVTGDVAWGGNTFFLVQQSPIPVRRDRLDALRAFTLAVRKAANAQGYPAVDHVEVFGPPSRPDAHSRNYVLCPSGEYDRSPCGTGTSAKLACLAADGKLAPGATWRQESVIGSVFSASYTRPAAPLAGVPADAVLPLIHGRAHVTLDATLVFDPADPFAWGLG